MQCVQPLPQSILLTETSKRRRSSLVQSPVVAIKPKHRCRSLTERSSHTETIVPTPSLNTINTTMDTLNSEDQSSPTRKISLTDFKIDLLEESSLGSLKEKLFKCMLLLHYDSNRRCSILPQLPSLLHCMQPKDPTTEVSNVVYLEIQSERADNKATIAKLLAWLHQTFVVEL